MSKNEDIYVVALDGGFNCVFITKTQLEKLKGSLTEDSPAEDKITIDIDLQEVVEVSKKALQELTKPRSKQLEEQLEKLDIKTG